MSETCTGGSVGGAIPDANGPSAARRGADRLSLCLSLAAAPTFAIMALLTGIGGAPDMLCSDASPLGGMAAMYALMSAFHAAPWLKLISRRVPKNSRKRMLAI